MIPIAANDDAFSVHVVILTTFILFQVIIYDNGTQKVSKTCTGISTTVWASAIVCSSSDYCLAKAFLVLAYHCVQHNSSSNDSDQVYPSESTTTGTTLRHRRCYINDPQEHVIASLTMLQHCDYILSDFFMLRHCDYIL